MAGERQSIKFGAMIDMIDAQHTVVQTKLEAIQSRKSELSIGDMFEMQLLMNKLAQLCEMATNLMSSMHQSTNSMARNVRGG